MKKSVFILYLVSLIHNFSVAQDYHALDSLRHKLAIVKNDSSRASLLLRLSRNYRGVIGPDSSIFYASKALILAREINSPEIEVDAMAQITISKMQLGNESGALQTVLEANKIAEKYGLKALRSGLFLLSGIIYRMSNNYPKALDEFRKIEAFADSTNNIFFIIISRSQMALTFSDLNQLDSALYYGHFAYDYAQKFDNTNRYAPYALGVVNFKKENYKVALNYFHEAIKFSFALDNINGLIQIAKVYHKMGIPDSTIWYANKALEMSLEGKFFLDIIEANNLLSEIYEKQDPVKALQYSKSANAYRDTLDNLRRSTTLEAYTDFDQQERQLEIEAAEKEYRSKVQRLWIFSITGALLSAILVAFILFRNNKNKQKVNKQLQVQKEEIQTTLNQLKSTQSQLIQSEKMASLGELTAGIAHEIQNPLNFVNNFSDVSKELMSELKAESSKGKRKRDEKLEAEILEDIDQNLDKIHHHGMRASEIVKSMLQHSRTGTGEKEPTDINVLADEYLRLAYHGMRAKDKSFNAEFKTDFDPDLPKINIVPQDIGRVLLNLINNAFQAVAGIEKSEVIISTKKLLDNIEIRVVDNGPGIPNEFKDKIFQPFFTTKPAGQGTGLGLSLSYDIVKAHGGELKVDTQFGSYTEFTILLPQ